MPVSVSYLSGGRRWQAPAGGVYIPTKVVC